MFSSQHSEKKEKTSMFVFMVKFVSNCFWFVVVVVSKKLNTLTEK